MIHIEIPVYEPTDKLEPHIGAILTGSRDCYITATLAELVQAYKTEAELRLTLHSIGTDPENLEAMIDLAVELRAKAKHWSKTNMNNIRVAGELTVAIEALRVIAGELEAALRASKAA